MNVQTENRFSSKNFQGVSIEMGRHEKISFGTVKSPSIFAQMQIERLNKAARLNG